MLSKTTKLSKSELIRKLQSITDNKIGVIEVFDRNDKSKVVGEFDRLLRNGHFSIIFIGG
jgi:hypothetical protein